MTENIGDKWDRKYQSKNTISGRPADVLTANSHLLPDHGTALDLACGPGGNAVFLATHGLNTHAWDLSGVALSHLNQISDSRGLNIITDQRDVVMNPPQADSFDVITVSNFLDRKLFPSIVNALRPDGLVFYQTYTEERTVKPVPGNPDYKLDINELITLFNKLTVRYYREDGKVNSDEKYQGIAMIVAQKIIRGKD